MEEKLKSFLERLEALPNEISDLQIEVIESSDNLQDIELKISKKESEIKFHILNAVDDAGKKIHTNAELREAAFNEDAEDDRELQDLYLDRRSLQNKIQKAKVGIENLSNYQRNLRILIEHMSNNR